jgi:hypothetical protein
MTLMKPRKSRKNQAKLAAVMVESTMRGKKSPQTSWRFCGNCEDSGLKEANHG